MFSSIGRALSSSLNPFCIPSGSQGIPSGKNSKKSPSCLAYSVIFLRAGKLLLGSRRLLIYCKPSLTEIQSAWPQNEMTLSVSFQACTWRTISQNHAIYKVDLVVSV